MVEILAYVLVTFDSRKAIIYILKIFQLLLYESLH